MTGQLVDRIYEAAFVPDLWPGILERMAAGSGASAGAMMIYDEDGARSCQTPELDDIMADYCARDDWRRSAVTLYMRDAPPPAFVHDPDYFPAEVLGSDAVVGACRARGKGSAITTCLALPTTEDAIVVFERSGDAEPPGAEALSWLNSLRPHLARSSMISARLGLEQANTTVQTLARLGLPAAVLTSSATLLAANDLFEALKRPFRFEARDRLSMQNPASDALFRAAVAGAASRAGAVKSIPLMAGEAHGAMIIHVVPVERSARDLFGRATSLVMVTPVGTAKVPDRAMLSGLFDLSPAEARLVQKLSQGLTIGEVGRELDLSVTTLRTQLRSVFAKTGISRQIDLSRLVGSLGVVSP